MNQSPINYNATILNGKQLYSGVGYYPIYLARGKKYELSTNGSSMRITVEKDGSKKERLCIRVEKPEEIQEIEWFSERWKRRKGNGYVVMEQRKASGGLTGYFKITELSKSKDKENLWIYFKGRGRS